ncbi:MAG: hypothetical protein HS111_33165 [Kofleriaceae bacterium]|nr:hypothetical protein [Kofleriaceae bacterium]
MIELDPAGSQALREEAGARLAELDDDAAAMDHYAALLALTPDSSVTQEKLRQLAQRSGGYRPLSPQASPPPPSTPSCRRARSSSCPRPPAPASICSTIRTRARIELYQRALELPGAGDKEQLPVCRRLSELYCGSTGGRRERFAILERLTTLEPSATTRRGVIGEAARLAESLGEMTDKALALWRQRIDRDPSDLGALDSAILLLETAARWRELVVALDQRASRDVSAARKRADLATRIAVVYRDRIDDAEQAIAAWQRVQREFGDDPETVGALTDLLAGGRALARARRPAERTSGTDVERTTRRLNRLGEALATHLGEPARARWRPSAPRSRSIRSTSRPAAGLLTLLDAPEHCKARRRRPGHQLPREPGLGRGPGSCRRASGSTPPTIAPGWRSCARPPSIQQQHTGDLAGADDNLATRPSAAGAPRLRRAWRASSATSPPAPSAWRWRDRALAAAIAALADDPGGHAARLRLVRAELLADPLRDASGARSTST